MDHKLEAVEKALKNALYAAEKVTSVSFFPDSDGALPVTLIALQIYNTLGWEYLSKVDVPRFVPPKPPPTPSSY